MTEQEKQMIAGLADRLRNAPPPHVDRDADDLIRHTIGAQPDALYVLTQTVLIQEMALNQAKAQIEDLKQRAAAPQAPPQPFLPSQGYQTGYAPAPAPSGGGMFSGFLHQAATTAAGVIAGDLAFEALGSLFGGHRGGLFGGGGGFFGGGSGIMPGSETVVNNYYGDDPSGQGGDDSQFAAAADQSGDDMSSDIEDDRDSGGDAFDSGGGDDGSGSFDV